ncbi:MAG: SusC/RagA family TonB-linked outer membrane protein [Ignavibacteriales bacterium]|nr:SusC/RagA family TonB-linked outer membrane protein [Ignavibacteriales bacterium]
MRKLSCYIFVSLIALALGASVALAQLGTIKGTITDAQTGEAMIGANVFLEKTSYGAASDSKGVYTIQNVLPGPYTLVVSYIGYEQYRVSVAVQSDKTSAVDIKLKSSAVTLSGVVVTAIGTRVEREKMGVSVSSVNAASLATVGTNDLVAGLAAKAPGITTIESTGDPGAATRIVLRGVRSLNNNNSPLIVLDGVPIFSGTSIGGGTAYVAAESRVNDINPDNIESIEVYKGPAAAALWGSRAANGVIAITTKSGGQTGSKKLSISVRSRTSGDQLLREFPLQQKFGQGQNGAFLFNGVRSWGDPIWLRAGGADALDRTNYQYATIVTKNSKDVFNHATDLFRNPITVDAGVTLRGGDEWSDFLVDMSQLNQQGIILSNSDLLRTSIRANATRRFTENVIVKITSQYVRSKTSRIQQGSNVSGLLLGGLRTPPDFNQSPYLTDYVSPTGAITYGVQRTFRNMSANPALGPGFNNPLYIIYNIPTTLNTDRLLGTVELTYDPMKWLNFVYRLGGDYYTDREVSTYPPGDASYPTGDTYRSFNTNYQVNSDLLGTAKYDYNENINGSLMLGFHIDHRQNHSISTDATAFILYDAPATFSNALNYAPGEGFSIIRSAAVFGEATLDLYKQVFIRGTGRLESASTYGADATKSYFYPSASVAWQFTEVPLFKDNGILSYGKLRVAYGTAANQPGAYVTKTYFGNALPGNGWQTGLSGIQYGGAPLRGTRLGNTTLKPEMTSETEFGLDLRFLNDRLSVGVTQYVNKTTDALLNVTVAPTSGYTSQTANAAKLENSGTELQIMAEWLRIEPFSWNTTINWSKNKNLVTDLAGVSVITLAGFVGSTSSAILNQPVGILYGTRWARNADQTIKLDANGFPQIDATSGILGDPNPDWRAGFINTLRYERLALNVVLDIKKGGKVWNGTKGALYSYGTHGDMDMWTTISSAQAAALKNWAGNTPSKVIAGSTTQKRYYTNADGSVSFRGKIGNFGAGDVILDEDWYRNGLANGFNGPTEQFVEDAGYVRLREVSLSYSMPLHFLGLQNLTVSVTGRNLALWTDYTGNDPETNLQGTGNGIGIDYFNNPTTKSWTISLQIDY